MDVIVPELGESIAEATVGRWLKKLGESVAVDEPIVELETDKVNVEVPSPIAGVLESQLAAEGDDIAVGAVIARVSEGAVVAKPAGDPKGDSSQTPKEESPSTEKTTSGGSKGFGPASEKLMKEAGLEPSQIEPSGPKGNITKTDVLKAADAVKEVQAPVQTVVASPPPPPPAATPSPKGERALDPRGEEAVRMSRLRQRIATRLKEAQNTAAMLTTFNEVNMKHLMDMRKQYKASFEKKYGVRLGFMSFFVQAVISALREYAAINAEIYGDHIIYKNYYDIGIAVGTPMGLVVPVLRDADKMSIADIEHKIADFGVRAREGKLTLDEMSGGTFTITNGGVFGSLLSTPILNPPQSGILGLHKIQKRPIVDDNGEISIGEMMYMAFSYDHRIVDGREAVSFLVRIKEMIEDPVRLMMDI